MYTCPCCGYKTLEEKPPGTYEICELCGWEDDFVQFKDPDYEGGANGESLREAQYNFLKESKDENYGEEYVKDNEWKILSSPDETTRLKNVKTDFIGDKNGNVSKK